MKYLFVYNKKAGKKFKTDLVEQITELLPVFTKFHFVEIQDIKAFSDIHNFDVLVAIGGDGTVNTIASLANQYKKVLGIIPKGSGDGLARFLGIKRDVNQAVKTLLENEIIDIDTAYLSNNFFINVAGTGFEAQVAHRFGESGIRGLFGYAKTIMRIFKKHEERFVKMKVDGNALSISYFSLSIANGSQWGNNFEIASKADIQDGLLDVAVMKKPKWYQIISLISFLKNNKQQDTKLFTYYKASEIDIKKSGKIWHIDGEPVLLKNKKEIRLVPLSLKVIVPK